MTVKNTNAAFKKIARLGLASLTVGAISIYSLPAYAQVDEIIVTARKAQESLQDVPVAVTAFTGDFFEDSGLVEIADIGKLTPNFDIQENAVSGSLFSNITIRGQSALSRQLSSDQAVGIIVNGAPVTRGTNIFSNLFDIEQIEVLKGPQGTLFGKNTTGGAVIITTTAPKLGEFEAYVEADIGNFGRNDFEGVFNVPIGEDFALRVGAATQNREAFNFGVRRSSLADTVGTITGDELDDDDEVFYRVSALYEPSDQLSIRVNADYHEVEEAGQGTRVLNDAAIFGGAVTIAFATPLDLGQRAVAQQQFQTPSVDAEEFNINATISYDFGGVTLESITSYRDQFALQINPFAGAAQVNLGQDADIFAQELRLSGDALADRLKWQVGGFYATEQGIDLDTVGALNTLEAKNDTIAVFGQGTYAISDRLNFTGGLRYTDETRSLARVQPTVLSLVPEQEVSFDGLSWTAGLDYELTDDTLVYGTISRGFRSGGVDDEAIGSIGTTQTDINGVQFVTTVDDITIDPEFVLNYEVGFKADFLDNTVRWNSAAFFTDYTDIQVLTFDPVLVDPVTLQAIQTLSNGAEATLYGFESEVTWTPNDNFSAGGTVGYTFGEFDEFIDSSFVNGVEVITDRTEENLGGVEWQFSAYGRYEHDLSDTIRAGAQLNYTFRGDEELLAGTEAALFTGALEEQLELESYGLFNGQIDFDIEGLGAGTNIAFYGRNLFDNTFDSSGFALTAFGAPLAQRAPGAPRTYGVRVRQSF